VAVALKTQIRPWIDRIDAMELRERVLLLLAVVVVLFLLVDSLALQPTLKAQQSAEARIADLEQKLAAQRQQALLLGFKVDEEDPLAARKRSRDELAAELADLDQHLMSQLGALVQPAQAAELLKQMLERNTGLTLASLEARAEALDDPAVARAPGSGLGRYQLELAVEGSFLDVLRYLRELETMPWKFFWQKVDFQALDYPRAVTRLRLYTLGALDG
jgi:MSHA biogenesis protein MshJ